MTHGRTTLLCLLGSLLACAGAKAVVADNNPYQPIVDRNVFGLKPPPPPPSPEANKPPPPKITLTGITTILGNKRALLKTPPAPAKPGEQAKPEQFYMLTEGQRDGEIEVLQIDEKTGSVKVSNSGEVVTLTFEKDGNKAPSAPAGTPGGQIPAPPGLNTLPAPGFSPGLKPLPTRTLRTPTPPGAQSSSSAGLPTASVETAGTAASAVSPFASPAGVPSAAAYSSPAMTPRPQPVAQDLTADQQAVLMEVERERLQKQGNPLANLIPTTRYTQPTAPPATAPNAGPVPNLPPRAPSLPVIMPQ